MFLFSNFAFIAQSPSVCPSCFHLTVAFFCISAPASSPLFFIFFVFFVFLGTSTALGLALFCEGRTTPTGTALARPMLTALALGEPPQRGLSRFRLIKLFGYASRSGTSLSSSSPSALGFLEENPWSPSLPCWLARFLFVGLSVISKAIIQFPAPFGVDPPLIEAAPPLCQF